MTGREQVRGLLMAAGILVLAGCGARQTSGPAGPDRVAVQSVKTADFAAPAEDFEAEDVRMDAGGPEENAASGMEMPGEDNAKRIRTVDLTVRLENDAGINDTADRIESVVKKFHGYVTDRSMSYSSHNAGGSITAKIPKEEVDGFLAGLRRQGLNVSRIDDRTEDVTQHYVDVEARLRAKQTEVDRLQSYLEKAEDTDTLLKVESHLTAAISDLESYKAQMNSLNARIDRTTVRISLECERTIHEETTGEMAERILKNTFRDTLETFLEGANLFLGAIATLIWLIPIGMIVITALYRTIRWNRDRGSGKKEKPQKKTAKGGRKPQEQDFQQQEQETQSKTENEPDEK